MKKISPHGSATITCGGELSNDSENLILTSGTRKSFFYSLTNKLTNTEIDQIIICIKKYMFDFFVILIF